MFAARGAKIVRHSFHVLHDGTQSSNLHYIGMTRRTAFRFAYNGA